MAQPWWRRLWRAEPAFTADEWQAVVDGSPLIRGLGADDQARIARLADRFLHDKAITPAHDLVLAPRDRLALAAHACLPLLRFGESGLRGWSQVIVHPGAFRVDHRRHGAPHEIDELEVVHEGTEDREGESWEYGPMVLSWADLDAEIREPEPGYQLVVHEMAHKLDALDGLLDGTPPLPAAWQREWARDFGAAFESLNALLDADPDAETPIDPYAAEAPDEFFAVCSEYHFTAPDALRATYPAVAAHLERFYGPPPRLAIAG